MNWKAETALFIILNERHQRFMNEVRNTHTVIDKSNLIFSILLMLGFLFFAQSYNASLAYANDLSFTATKEKIFKKYKIREAKPNEFPIIVFDKDKVPPVLKHGDAETGTIRWLNDHTIIYVPQPKKMAEENGYQPNSLSLISVNLKTLEKKELLNLNIDHFCYDYETKNFSASSFIYSQKPRHKPDVRSIHGKLGGTLKDEVYPFEEKSDGLSGHYYLNPLDCKHYQAYPIAAKNPQWLLRENDGYITTEYDGHSATVGAYYLHTNNKPVKRFEVGMYSSPVFQYDTFSKLYWHSETLPDRRMKVWRFDKDFNLFSEEVYPDGPWGVGHPISILQYSVRPGFLVMRYIEDEKGLKPVHSIVYLLRKDGSITDISEDVLSGPLVVSPDGCKVASAKRSLPIKGMGKISGEITVLNVCKNFERKNP